MFSSLVKKVNHALKPTERALLLTENGLYNLHPKKFTLKRMTPIHLITSATLSPFCDGFFVLHMKDSQNKKDQEFDYVCECEKKTEFISVLSTALSKVNGAPLKIDFLEK
jgi:hypothetical protein